MIFRINFTVKFSVALQALKRKKRHEQQLDQLLSTMSTLENQRTTLENLTVHDEVIGTLKDAAKVLKKANKQLNLDEVTATMEEINEINDIANEISDAIANVRVSNADNDELEKELNDLKQEELHGKNIPLKLPDVPNINVELPSAKKQKQEMKELEQRALTS